MTRDERLFAYRCAALTGIMACPTDDTWTRRVVDVEMIARRMLTLEDASDAELAKATSKGRLPKESGP